MAALTPLAIAMLALLRERPMHPYEMHQTLLERHQDRVMKVRPGSLYHTIERLHSDGLVAVKSVEREGNRPERTTYRILPAGERALTQRVADLLHEWGTDYPSFPVAIGEAHFLPKETAISSLKERMALIERDLAVIENGQHEATKRGVDPVVLLSGNYLHHMLSAEHDWLVRTIELIETEEYSWPNN
ncbi:PadR family transcriptional regulator [Branchiibius hedensis]|uniref:DNA-binding transcriptional regulator, PadR family n=1 Tax=Branchiibius hedensis TaxID=672460 RepID=A0A2Y9C272_9MICO|nr:PadR family transcriptional regulator [Branchiibius hedensis]PWJ26782.1 PadR family transcriptional regulator [Branchiibius hedensis]SSA35593.1 DNA-binding transcriptional regulator, PadR family [Branchiibius hedensis]